MKKNVMRKCGWVVAVAAVCSSSCVAVAAEATPLGVLDPEDATAYLTAGAQIFKGDLVKQGTGTTTLSLADVHTAGGRIVVADGTLAVSGATAANDPGKPWGVLSNAVVWLDASMPETIGFVEGSSVNVSEWRDVRETGTGSASSPYLYRRAVAYTNIGHSATYAPDPAGWFPEYVPANGGENAYVDFGQYSSGRMVRFLDISGNVSAISNMRHAFVVLGTHDGHYGFLFNPGSGNAIFVPQSYGNLVNCTPGKFIQQAGGWSVLLTGVFRVDGKAVDPVNEAGPNGGYQLLDIAAGKDGWNPVGMFSHETFASQANGYRQGGGRLCEAILFDKPLEERDRLKIEAYLRWKWFGAEVAAPTCFVNKDATLAIDNSGGGCKDLTVIGNGPVTLEAGTLDTVDPVALTVAEGTTYNATTGGVERVSGGGSSFVKTGDGEMVVQKVSDGLAKIEVQEGVLRLRQGMVSPFSVPANLCGYIEDPSFEAFSDTTIPDSGLSLNSAGKHGWKTYGSHEKGNVAKWQTGGGYFNMAGIPYPDGIYVGVLHIRGGLQTTVTLPADGVYRLSYWVAQRPNYKGHEHRVLIDGLPVAEVKAWDPSSDWHLVSFRLPRLSAGEHTLVLASDDNNSTATRTVDFSVTDNIMSTGNLVALVDDFHVDWIESGDDLVSVSNASFEVTSFSARGYEKNPEDLGGWVLGPVDETNYVVLEQTWNGRPTLHPASDGCRILNLVNQVHVGQDVTFPKAGTYTLTLVAGSAAGNDIASYPGKLRFMLGETEIGALELQTNGKASIMKTFNLQFAVPEANYTARLYIANIRGGSIVSVDDIRISAFEPGVNVVAENSFASTGWSVYEPESDIYDGSGKVEWLPQALSDVAWGPVTYGEDGNRVGIRNNASIWRTVAFPAAGTYRLSVASIGRFYRYNDRHLEDPGILTRYSGNAFSAWVAKGGVTNVVGTFGVDDRERFVTHRFLFELPEGGDWEVGFSGLKESEHKIAGKGSWYSNGGVLDGLVVEAVTAAAKPEIPEAVEIDVAERAVLALDYLGTNKVAAVRYAGRNYSGEINAVTCPAFITGAGVLYVQPKGTVLMFR